MPTAPPMAGLRSAPHNLGVERAVLAAILEDPRTLEAARAADLAADDFFLPAHQTLFRRIEGMAARGAPPDAVALAGELERAGELKNIGGADYLGNLARCEARAENLAAYARSIRRHASHRALIEELSALCQFSSAPEADLESLCRWLELLSLHLKKRLARDEALAVSSGATEASDARDAEWICKPFVAAGAITEISGKVKQAGKTTFVTHLCAAVLDGREFLGPPAAKSPVIYLTEQPPATFRLALRRAGLLGREDFAVVYWNRVAGMPWDVLAGRAIAECPRRGARLLVVDTLAQFAGIAGDAENNSGDALRAMQPLQQAAAGGLGVILVRQERKAGGPISDAGRGSSAFAGAVDIVISLRPFEAGPAGNLRLLQAVSRFDDAPHDWVVAWSPEAGYQLRGTAADFSRERARQTLLNAAPRSRSEAILSEQLRAAVGLAKSSFLRALAELLRSGQLTRSGAGTKRDPYRYWIPDSGSPRIC